MWNVILFLIELVIFFISKIFQHFTSQINLQITSNLIDILKIAFPAVLSIISILYTKHSLDIQREHNQTMGLDP